jgi:hypothetical protein
MNIIVEITYNHNLVKGDIIEVYAKTIANQDTILTSLAEHTFRIETKKGTKKELGCLTSKNVAYVARTLMDTKDEIINATMERKTNIYDLYKHSTRKITLEKISNQELKVTVEGSEKTINKIGQTLDEMFYISPEEITASKKKLSTYITRVVFGNITRDRF